MSSQSYTVEFSRPPTIGDIREALDDIEKALQDRGDVAISIRSIRPRAGFEAAFAGRSPAVASITGSVSTTAARM